MDNQPDPALPHHNRAHSPAVIAPGTGDALKGANGKVRLGIVGSTPSGSVESAEYGASACPRTLLCRHVPAAHSPRVEEGEGASRCG
jgi:hypothetical protein